MRKRLQNDAGVAGSFWFFADAIGGLKLFIWGLEGMMSRGMHLLLFSVSWNRHSLCSARYSYGVFAFAIGWWGHLSVCGKEKRCCRLLESSVFRCILPDDTEETHRYGLRVSVIWDRNYSSCSCYFALWLIGVIRWMRAFALLFVNDDVFSGRLAVWLCRSLFLFMLAPQLAWKKTKTNKPPLKTDKTITMVL